MLLNFKVHYHIHDTQPLVRILSQLDPVSVHLFYGLKIDFIIILPSTPRSSNGSLLFRFSHQTSVCTSLHPHKIYVPSPPHSFHLITRIIFNEQYRSQSSSLCSFLHSTTTSSLSGLNLFDQKHIGAMLNIL
jgi:hypothetical protein